VGLSFAATGQQCPRFRFDGILAPGTTHRIAGRTWHVHAACGHDPHSVVLFDSSSGVLISADALWESGFGVVFPELDGVGAFEEVGATLDLIEDLKPSCVIPGHGRPFSDVRKSLEYARARLRYFVEHPSKHSLHAAKVLVKFKLLELQSCSMAELWQWAQATPYVEMMRQRLFPLLSLAHMLDVLLADLVKSRAATRQGDRIDNTN
jgi:glyoxylase-like metal-dependent hydrolase (beta-lactamase superfamily II)